MKSILPLIASILLVGCSPTVNVTTSSASIPSCVASMKPLTPSMTLTPVDESKGRGTLEVQVATAGPAKYGLMAKAADVASLRIEVTVGGLEEPLVKTIDIKSGNHGSASFSNLPAGEVGVRASALDGDGDVLGSDETTAIIKKNGVTVAKLTIVLGESDGRLKADVTFVETKPKADD